MRPPGIDPTAHDIRPEDNRLSRRSAVALTSVFLLLIALPGVLREFSGDAVRGAFAHIIDWQDGKTVDRLRTVEKTIDNGAWTKPIRQQVQTVLYQVFREGNRKVVVGRDGWLFHRPGIRALTGRGPVLGPAKTSAKGHQKVEAWEGPIPVIKEFAAQLKERGIDLVLVPVPDKVSLKAEEVAPPFFQLLQSAEGSGGSLYWKARAGSHGMGGGSTRVVDWVGEKISEITAAIRKWAVLPTPLYATSQIPRITHPDAQELIDRRFQFPLARHWDALTPLFREPKIIASDEKSAALLSDSHAQPIALQYWAHEVSVESEFKELRSGKAILSERQSHSGYGDLANSLDISKAVLSESIDHFTSFKTTPAVSDPASPIVLLGDSNVNMYDDPSLPFYMPGAGLGSWLSAYLGQPLHIIAINGGGATAVRQRFAALPDDVVRAKKLVIWVIAERDLFMDPAVARENGVEWKRVTFNPNKSPQQKPPDETQPADPGATSDSLVIEATVKAKSAMPAPHEVNYPDSVYVAEFTVDKVISGTYAQPELQVVLWNFRNRELQPGARLAVGQKVRLSLSDWLSKGDLTKTNASDDINRFDIPLLFAEKMEDAAP